MVRKIFLTTLLGASTLFGADVGMKDLTDMQNFYYQKGYNDASEKFYKSGYEQAVMDMLKQAQKYKTLVETYEAGKYYMQNNKITFPRVYRTRGMNGQYIVHIDTPEIKEKLSVEDIFVLPELDNISQGSYSNNSMISSAIDNEFNMIDINDPANSVNYNYISPANPNVSEIPATSPISIMKEFGTNFPKTERIKRVLDAGNVKYAELPDGYKAYFRNETDFKTFCKNTSGDATCQNLKQLQ